MKKRAWLALGIGIAAASALLWHRSSCQADEELVPLVLMPETTKLMFENNFVRVLESHLPAGAVEPKHRHPHNLTVFLGEYDVEIRSFGKDGGKAVRVHRVAGTVAWAEAAVHEVKNVGTTPSHTIRVELKNP